MISSAILVGGQSRRMGRDKASLPILGIPMALRAAKVLRNVTGAPPVLVAKNSRKYDDLGLRVISDYYPHACALAGIHAAIEDSVTRRVLITTCDQPFLKPALLLELIRTPGDVVVCEVAKKLEPFPGIYSKELLDILPDSFADGVLSIQENLFAVGFPSIMSESEVRALDPELRSFRNLNTPREVRRTRELARKS